MQEDYNMETLTSRERVWKTLRHEPVDRVPRQLWALPGVGMFRAEELQKMRERFPSDFAEPLVRPCIM